MASLTFFKYRFTPSWSLTILAFIFIFGLACLGFWQLERAAEKKSLIEQASQANLKKASPWQGELKPTPYQRLEVKGHYLPFFFFLDNQHYQHQFGYDILNPFQLANGKILMVNRGFIKALSSRQELPKVALPLGERVLIGQSYYPSPKGWLLGPAIEPRDEQHLVIEHLAPELFAKFLHKSVYPFIMRLDIGEQEGFIREWAIVSLPAERHYAYALQWFAMALIVFILWLCLNLKKDNE